MKRILLCLLLAGCASHSIPPPETVHTVYLPVAVPCKVVLPPKPDFPDTPEKLAPLDDVEWAKAQIAGNILHWQWEAAQGAALVACASPPPAAPPVPAPGVPG